MNVKGSFSNPSFLFDARLHPHKLRLIKDFLQNMTEVLQE